MTRQEVHDAVLATLLGLRGGNVRQVRVVARLYNDEYLGGDSATPAYLFIPDLHLMTRAGDEHYLYGHRRLDRTRWIDRDVLLGDLLERLALLRRSLGAENLLTVQLGDFMDLWREDERTSEGKDAFVGRILSENPAVNDRLVRRGDESLEAKILLGNHDDSANLSGSLRRARKSFRLKVGQREAVLATHGDLFDWFEDSVGHEVKEWFLERFGAGAQDAGPYRLDRTVGGQSPGLGGSEGAPPLVVESVADARALPDWVNVWVTVAPRDAGRIAESHSLLPRALRFAAGVRSGTSADLDRLGLRTGMSGLRAIVIGHSHHARLCLHLDTAHPEQNLVLADCGGWIETAQFRDGAVPSCQLGVLCGGDFRIYQLDPAPGLIRPG